MKSNVPYETESCEQHVTEYKKKGEAVRGAVTSGGQRAGTKELGEPLTRDSSDLRQKGKMPRGDAELTHEKGMKMCWPRAGTPHTDTG